MIQKNIKTQVNSSCALHYHIGIKHLSLESIKKLVTLLMVLEAKGLFRMICARHRFSSTNRWCHPVFRLSRAAMQQDSQPRRLNNHNLEYHLPYRHGISDNLLLVLNRIWDCGDVSEIAEETLTSTDGVSAASGFTRRGGFAIRDSATELSINGAVVDADRTIEFRYKESTGSPSEDHHWLKLCLHIVRAAALPIGNFRAVIGPVSNADTLGRLLFGLQVGGDEVQWWLGIARRHRGPQGPLKKTRFLEPENV